MQRDWPEARHVLIGHSHGGFVALSALRGATLDERICGVACLSTPFLMARVRPMSRLARAGLTVTPALLVAFGLGQAVERSPLGAIVDRHEPLQVAFGLLVLVLAAFAWRWTPRAVQALSARVFERMQLPELAPNQLFVMRAPGDEASAALGAAQILNFAVSRIWDRASSLLDDAIRRGDVWLEAVGRIRWPLHAFNAALVASALLLVLVVPRTADQRRYSKHRLRGAPEHRGRFLGTAARRILGETHRPAAARSDSGAVTCAVGLTRNTLCARARRRLAGAQRQCRTDASRCLDRSTIEARARLRTETPARPSCTALRIRIPRLLHH